MSNQVPPNAAVSSINIPALLSNDMIALSASLLLYGDGRLMVNNVLLSTEFMEGLF